MRVLPLSLDETLQKLCCVAHSDPVGRDEIVITTGCQLPGGASWKSFLPVPQAAGRPGIRALALDVRCWPGSVCDDEVYFPPVSVSEGSEFEVEPLRVLLVVDPLQQVTGDQVLEPWPLVGHE